MLPALTASVRLRDMVKLPTSQLMDKTKEVVEVDEVFDVVQVDEMAEGQGL